MSTTSHGQPRRRRLRLRRISTLRSLSRDNGGCHLRSQLADRVRSGAPYGTGRPLPRVSLPVLFGARAGSFVRRHFRRRRACYVVSRYPVFSPTLDGVNGTLQRTSFIGEVVLHADWRFGNDDSRDDVLRFELAQPLDEHAIADVWNERRDLVEAASPMQKNVDDRARPSAADELDGVMVFGTDGRRRMTH